MKSFWKRQGCLFAVALAAGGAGAFWGLQPALGMEAGIELGAPAAQGDPALGGMSGSLLAAAPDFSAFVQLSENGDGTALTAVSAYLSPTVFLGIAIFDSTNYTISTDLLPGQSGQGTGSGTGHFTMEDVYALDLNTFQLVGPYDVSVDIAVADATNVNAYVNQGITTQTDPLTGQTSIVRQRTIGNQASGNTAGSLSVSVDFRDGNGFVPVSQATGGLGVVGIYNVRSVERIH